MPLHIHIDINEYSLEKLHIGRLKGGTHPDDINTYLVVVGEEPLKLEDWKKHGVEYTHRYGDGALVCLRKALQALELQIGYKKLSSDPEEVKLRLEAETNRRRAAQLKVDLNKATHHCGYDFEIWKPTAVCECGAIATNPFYIMTKED